MSTQTPTTPIPSGQYAAPDPAPNTPTECERCGAPAISRKGVGKHDLWHRQQDVDARRQKKLLDRLEAFLDSVETNVDEHGQRLTIAAWIEQTDHALDALEQASRDLAETITKLSGPVAPATPVEILPWPGDPWEPDEDETVEPDDEEPAATTADAIVDGGHLDDPAPTVEPIRHRFDDDRDLF